MWSPGDIAKGEIRTDQTMVQKQKIKSKGKLMLIVVEINVREKQTAK